MRILTGFGGSSETCWLIRVTCWATVCSPATCLPGHSWHLLGQFKWIVHVRLHPRVISPFSRWWSQKTTSPTHKEFSQLLLISHMVFSYWPIQIPQVNPSRCGYFFQIVCCRWALYSYLYTTVWRMGIVTSTLYAAPTVCQSDYGAAPAGHRWWVQMHVHSTPFSTDTSLLKRVNTIWLCKTFYS